MTDNTTFFSIIIPLFNKEPYIFKTLKSVCNQTFTNFEIIVIDDGSTDKSPDVVKQFNDNRIIYHKIENQGVSIARNTGMQLAKSPYFAFIDADDFWKPNHLQTLFDLIEKFPNAGMYCSRYQTYITDSKFRKNKLIDIDDDYEGYVKDFFKSSWIDRVAHTSSVCIKHKVYEEIGGFDKTLTNGEDLDFWIRIGIKYPVAISNKITSSYYNTLETKSISQMPFIKKTRPNLNKYLEFENNNPSFKKFLDIYRIEYAVNYRVVGEIKKSKEYLKFVDNKNISIQSKILLYTPPFILKKMLKLRKKLKKLGIDFTIYH